MAGVAGGPYGPYGGGADGSDYADHAAGENGFGGHGAAERERLEERRNRLPESLRPDPFKLDVNYNDPADVVRTALCVEPRGGTLHVFMPPIERLDVYLDLVTAIEETCEELQTPVVIEGYEPPHDSRLKHIKVTPDPGVIEVNVHPAGGWDELVDITNGVYDDARQSRLGTEKFDLDGSHTGTGGGQPRRARRADRGRQPLAPSARPVEELLGLLEQPPVVVVPVQRQIHRADKSGAARRGSPSRFAVRVEDRFRADQGGTGDSAVAGRSDLPAPPCRRHRQHAPQ